MTLTASAEPTSAAPSPLRLRSPASASESPSPAATTSPVTPDSAPPPRCGRLGCPGQSARMRWQAAAGARCWAVPGTGAAWRRVERRQCRTHAAQSPAPPAGPPPAAAPAARAPPRRGPAVAPPEEPAPSPPVHAWRCDWLKTVPAAASCTSPTRDARRLRLVGSPRNPNTVLN